MTLITTLKLIHETEDSAHYAEGPGKDRYPLLGTLSVQKWALPKPTPSAIRLIRSRVGTLRSKQGDFPERLAAPARRALASAGITSLAQLAKHRESEVRALHGMGPSAVGQLRDALAVRGLSFKQE